MQNGAPQGTEGPVGAAEGYCQGHCQLNEAVARSGQSSGVSSLILRRQ